MSPFAPRKCRNFRGAKGDNAPIVSNPSLLLSLPEVLYNMPQGDFRWRSRSRRGLGPRWYTQVVERPHPARWMRSCRFWFSALAIQPYSPSGKPDGVREMCVSPRTQARLSADYGGPASPTRKRVPRLAGPTLHLFLSNALTRMNIMINSRTLLLPVVGNFLFTLAAHSAEPLVTAVAAEVLDPQVYAEWVDGAEKPIRPQDQRDLRALRFGSWARARASAATAASISASRRRPGRGTCESVSKRP